MSEYVEGHRAAVAEFTRRVEAVKDDQWGDTTPCEAWDVRALVDHVTSNHERLAGALRGEAPAAAAGSDLARRWQEACDGLFTALEVEGALAKIVPGPMGKMPAESMLGIITTDTLVHTWDLARAVGADEQLPLDLLERVYAAILPFDEMVRTPKVFGAKADVPDGADRQTEILAFFGRRA